MCCERGWLDIIVPEIFKKLHITFAVSECIHGEHYGRRYCLSCRRCSLGKVSAVLTRCCCCWCPLLIVAIRAWCWLSRPVPLTFCAINLNVSVAFHFQSFVISCASRVPVYWTRFVPNVYIAVFKIPALYLQELMVHVQAYIIWSLVLFWNNWLSRIFHIFTHFTD